MNNNDCILFYLRALIFLQDLNAEKSRSTDAHQVLVDQCNSLKEWLIDAQDKLSLYSTMTAHKPTLQSNLHSLQVGGLLYCSCTNKFTNKYMYTVTPAKNVAER